jgi:hypothetical protein
MTVQNTTPPTCKQSLQVGRETTDDDRRRAAMRDIDGILAATGRARLWLVVLACCALVWAINRIARWTI